MRWAEEDQVGHNCLFGLCLPYLVDYNTAINIAWWIRAWILGLDGLGSSPVFPTTSSVTLGKLLNLSGFQFP